MNKLLKIALFAGAAAIIAPKLVNGVPRNLAGAAGGFIAGGPLGAVGGYFAGPMISGFMGGTTASSAGTGVTVY